MPDVRTDENDNEQEQVSVFERLKHAPKVTFYPEGGELVAGDVLPRGRRTRGRP